VATGWLGGAPGVLTIRTFCWQMDSVGPGVLRRLYDAILAYARSARLSTVEMYTSTSSALRDFVISLGMVPKPGVLTVYTARAAATPGVKSAIKPFVSAAPLPYTRDAISVEVYNPTRVAAKLANLMKSAINRSYAINLLDTPYAPVPPDASMYVLQDESTFYAPGYAVARTRSDGSCAVTALFARNVDCVNTLLRFIANRCSGAVELHVREKITVSPRALLNGAWRVRVPGVLRWEAVAGSAHEKRTSTPSPRRVSLSHTVDVGDAMPLALARFAQGIDAVPPEGSEYALNRSSRPMVDAGGAARAAGACNLLAVYSADELEARPAVVAALRESALCQGNTYLAEAVDGLLGRGVAAVSQRTTRPAMFWVVTSEAAAEAASEAVAEVCAVVVTRVVTPRTEPLRYSSKRMDTAHWAKHGSRLQAAALQLEYICWREGVPLDTLRGLMTQLVARARTWACAHIWTQLRPEEAAQIAFLTGEGFVAQPGQVYVLKL
jgi:hypothetical protein